MTKKKKVTPVSKAATSAPQAASLDPFEPQAPGNVVAVPAPYKPKSNLPRDPLTGKLLPVQRKKRETQSLADAAQDAFTGLGGRIWLRKRAREHPKEFMALLARVAGDEGVSHGMSYVAVPIPVEVRETPLGVLEVAPDPFE